MWAVSFIEDGSRPWRIYPTRDGALEIAKGGQSVFPVEVKYDDPPTGTVDGRKPTKRRP